MLNLNCNDLNICSAFGSLTVRSLLDMREHYLNEFDFPDPYLQVRFYWAFYSKKKKIKKNKTRLCSFALPKDWVSSEGSLLEPLLKIEFQS